MKERIAHICSALSPARVFADIGCDHGYMTQYMLRNGLCERAYISDISAGSLKKAETLLSEYVAAGRCIPVVADGLDGIPEPCDLVLIAGMGGEEIVEILKRRPLPPRFVLQPMKNSEKLRRYLVAQGAKIERDYTFSEGTARKKYYDLILGRAEGGDSYTDLEFRYGRDNLGDETPAAFLSMMREEREKLRERSARRGINPSNRAKLKAALKETEEIINEIEKRL